MDRASFQIWRAFATSAFSSSWSEVRTVVVGPPAFQYRAVCVSAASIALNCIRATWIRPDTSSDTEGKGARSTMEISDADVSAPATLYQLGKDRPNGSGFMGWTISGGIGRSDQGTPAESTPPTCKR